MYFLMEGLRVQIVISKDVAEWYKDELHLKDGDTIRFFVRYGGIGGNIAGFSLGVNVEKAKNAHKTVTVSNIEFFVDESDVWYFDDQDLHVNLDELLNEPSFSYVSKNDEHPTS